MLPKSFAALFLLTYLTADHLRVQVKILSYLFSFFTFASVFFFFQYPNLSMTLDEKIIIWVKTLEKITENH